MRQSISPEVVLSANTSNNKFDSQDNDGTPEVSHIIRQHHYDDNENELRGIELSESRMKNDTQLKLQEETVLRDMDIKS